MAMKSRFEPHLEAATDRPSPRLIDPEAYDASEQEFAASLDDKPGARFVADEAALERESSHLPNSTLLQNHESVPRRADGQSDVFGATESADEPLATSPAPLADSWRQEVAAKMHRYRSHKRVPAPHYPSLQLKFEALDSGATARALPATPEVAEEQARPSFAAQEDVREQREIPSPEQWPAQLSAPSAKIIEFPVFAPPPPAADELAEPVWDRPRILEVPEVVPPPPALGGILIEPSEQSSQEKRKGFELPLIAAPFSRRIFAGVIDACIVVAAFALFAYIFLRIPAAVPPVRECVTVGAVLLGILWAGFQYLMLVHSGSSPGLFLAKLRLNRFDGTLVPLKLRRWRVLGSLLSCLSLGLGYAWCFLDEDQLCWHDRITQTYMAPVQK
jgi:uncharacterized RDD family membrane protein YckC